MSHQFSEDVMSHWEYLLGYHDKGRALWIDSMGRREPLARDEPSGIVLGPIFTQLGTEGWELVAVTPDQCVFKRLRQNDQD